MHSWSRSMDVICQAEATRVGDGGKRFVFRRKDWLMLEDESARCAEVLVEQLRRDCKIWSGKVKLFQSPCNRINLIGQRASNPSARDFQEGDKLDVLPDRKSCCCIL